MDGDTTLTATSTTAESLWSDTTLPATITDRETRSVELGFKFQASVDGTITGIRFYKGPENTGTHVGNLWTATGTNLGSVTFTNETSSGWQTAYFDTPITISANTTYVASYLAPNGGYSLDVNYFSSAYSNGSYLTALADGTDGRNGVYRYGNASSFPTNSWRSSNYWVDVIFEPGAVVNRPPVATDDSGFSTPADTALRIAVADLLANDSDPDGDPLTITGVTSGTGGTVALDTATSEVVFTPDAGHEGAASFTYTVSDSQGNSDVGAVAVTVGEPPTVSIYSLWSDSVVPGTLSAADTGAVELGVKVRAEFNGTINGIRFYKGPNNTGTHVGTLWTATGTNLGSVTFTNETSGGWQTATFANPIQVTANTTYVASYHAPNGGYSIDPNYFGTAYTNGPLTALSSAEGGGNGVYAYGNGGFPTSSWQASNYYVDVIFQSDGTEPPNSVPVANDDSGFATNKDTTLTILGSQLTANDTDVDNDPLTVTQVTSGSGGTVTLDAATQEITFTPEVGYTGPAAFTYTVSDGEATAQANVDVSVLAPLDANAIVLENQKQGTPRSEWDLSDGGSSTIEGFATDMSVNRGQRIDFKINTDSTDYRVDIYRLGWYGGLGARKMGTIDRTLSSPQNQPNPFYDSATGLVDADNWTVSASWDVPADAVSGVYIAKLVREDGTFGENHIPFTVRNDGGTSTMVMQTSDTTWQAYNTWGGNSLYVGSPDDRAYKVSYNRPFANRAGGAYTGPRDFLFDSDYPMLRWLERNGYDVSYISGIDSDRYGSQLLNHNTFISVGHDEYWSGQQRANVEAARDAGVNLAFFSGNEVFWKTRWEADADGTPHRTLVSYKETLANDKIDPSAEWTGTWRDPRFSPPSDGGRPENALTGTIFTVNDSSLDRMGVDADDGKMRFWRNTDIATMAPGERTTLTANVLTYEWDEDLDNGFRPAGAFRLSETYDPSTLYLADYGSTYIGAPAIHSMVMHRASSGALVFGAGTPRWAWGLDPTHDIDLGGTDPYATDIRMAQATVNLFADMGAQPVTLQSGLVPAAQSTDTVAPVSIVSSPGDGGSVALGTVTVTGSATDTGGQVGGVEVSTDGGTTWWRAIGRSAWTYEWTPSASGTYTIQSRAVDDSGNLEAPANSVTVSVGDGGGGGGGGGGGTTEPPTVEGYTIFDTATAVPAILTDPDTAPVELGVKFQADTAGDVSGILFYKGGSNTGTHTGSLWTTSGTRLASVTFTNETASGWQVANFNEPVPITANTTYIASYHAPNGAYSTDYGYFTSDVVNGPLRALSDGSSGGNGVYAYGPEGSFPSGSWNSSNYWVDVVFQPTVAA